MATWLQRWMLVSGAFILSASAVSSEVTEYRLGDFLEDAFDVLGFHFLDSIAAFPDYFYLLGLFAAVGIVWAAWRHKWKIG